ncbi:MAG: adenine deaminase [Alloprevotella sp.]
MKSSTIIKENASSLLLTGGSVVDVATGRLREADVLIRNGRIETIGSPITDPADAAIDCSGRVITAGFVDAHVHIESSMVLPQAFGEAVLPHGTTTVIADPHEAVNVGGAAALDVFLEEARLSPADVFTVVPSSVPATPFDTNGAGEFTADDMKPYVCRDDVVGLGEVMCFVDVKNKRREILDKIDLFKDKTIDGHTAGMPEEWVEEYAAAGVENDHECVSAEALLHRYACGMNIYVREGSAARNASELLTAVKTHGLDTGRFAFCTDDKHLATIAREGHISYIVRMALAMGFSWPEVARMASDNACRYYGLKDRGRIAEGYRADIVVTDPACQHIDWVIKDGRMVAQNQRVLPGVSHHKEVRRFENTVKFRTLSPEDFTLPDRLRHVALELTEGQLLTNLKHLEGDEWRGLPLLATIERHGRNGNMAVCLLEGYGIKGGAVATSVSHDSHNVVCAGDNPEDMAVATNALRDMGGGYVVASGGRVVASLALPAFGLMATGDADTVAGRISLLETAAHRLGVNQGIDPFITLSFVALPVIPFVRLLDTGLFLTDTQKFL